MASVSTQRIPSIHGAFGGPAALFGAPANMGPAQASWNRIPNVCAPRVRTYDASAPASASGIAPRTTPLALRSCPSGSRPRRTTMSMGSPPFAAPPRRAPAERTASALKASVSPAPLVVLPKPLPPAPAEDPFADSNQVEVVVLTPLPPAPRPRVSAPSVAHASPPSACVRPGPSPLVPPGLGHARGVVKDTRGRIVANALLHRGSGRPMGTYLRRRLSGEAHVYVPSGLSRLVAVA